MRDLMVRDDDGDRHPSIAGARRAADFEYVLDAQAVERPPVISLEQAWAAVRRNTLLLVISTALGLAGAYAWVSRETQLFESSAVIRLLDARGALTGGIGGGAQTSSMGAGVDPMLSEIMVLEGREVLGRVVTERGLRLVDAASYSPPAWATDVQVTLPDHEFRAIEVSFEEGVVTARATPTPIPLPETAGGVAAGLSGIRDFARRLGFAGFGAPASASGGTQPPSAAHPASVRGTAASYGSVLRLGGVQFLVPSRPQGVASASLLVLPRDAAVNQLTSMVSAAPRRGTDGIDVRVVSPSPIAARDMVNSVVLVYQDENARSGQDQATRRRTFLETQLAEQDAELAAAQSQLAAFRAGRQMYSSQERLQAEQATMLELETRRRELESNRRLYQSLRTSLDEPGRWTGDYGVLVSSPGIAENPVVSEYYSQLLQYQIARDTMTTGPRARTALHPDVQQLDSLLAQTERRLGEALYSQVQSIDARILELMVMREASANQLGDPLMAEAEEDRLSRRVETFQQLSDQLRSEVQRASVDEAVETGQVEIVELAAAALPIDSRRYQKLFLGAVGGLLLALAFSLIREAANRTIVRPEDIERALHLTNLAVIPRIQGLGKARRRARRALMSGRNGDRKERVTEPADLGHWARGDAARVAGSGVHLIADPEGVEAYRTLRANLIFSPSSQSIRTLVVTSAAAGEGKTMTVANLGLAFAMQGARVIMIDADLRRPDLAKLMDLPKSPGLAEVLLGEATTQEAVRWVGAGGLDLMPAGYLPRNPSELLGGRRMEQLLEDLKERYDLVLVDCPPLLATSDGAVLGAMSDGVLLVVRAGYTDKRATAQVLEQVRRVGANVVGTVLNDPNGKVPDHGGYYGYRYSYEAKPEGRRPAATAKREPVHR